MKKNIFIPILFVLFLEKVLSLAGVDILGAGLQGWKASARLECLA